MVALSEQPRIIRAGKHKPAEPNILNQLHRRRNNQRVRETPEVVKTDQKLDDDILQILC